MKLKKWGWPLVVGVMVLIIFYTIIGTAFPENPGTYVYFEKVSNMPYQYHEKTLSSKDFWEVGGDCDDRSNAFKDYLLSRGETNVQMCLIKTKKDGILVASGESYGHAVVVWNSRVYDPSPIKECRVYNMDIDLYKQLLKKNGYNIWYWEGDGEGTYF